MPRPHTPSARVHCVSAVVHVVGTCISLQSPISLRAFMNNPPHVACTPTWHTPAPVPAVPRPISPHIASALARHLRAPPKADILPPPLAAKHFILSQRAPQEGVAVRLLRAAATPW